MDFVALFDEHARQILDAAETAASTGNICSEMTILIGDDGAIRMFADSDWTLDSLAHHHGAKSAFRVQENNGTVRVEGREGQRKCVLESTPPAVIARRLLSSVNSRAY